MRKLWWFLPFFAIFLITCILLQLYTLKQLNEYQPRHPKNKIFSIFAPTSLREAKIEKILFFGYLATVSETATGQGCFKVLVHILFDFDILWQISSFFWILYTFSLIFKFIKNFGGFLTNFRGFLTFLIFFFHYFDRFLHKLMF